MADGFPHNVFISWSGPFAQAVADALRTFLPDVIQTCKPWVSLDIESGTPWSVEIHKALRSINLGIVVLTPQNLTAPWLHYEAGALVVGIDESATRVCPYLVEVKKEDVRRPLSDLNVVLANEAETYKMLHTLALKLSPELIEGGRLKRQFDRVWKDFEGRLQEIRGQFQDVAAPPKRTPDELLAELLSEIRSMRSRPAEPISSLASIQSVGVDDGKSLCDQLVTAALARSELGAEWSLNPTSRTIRLKMDPLTPEPRIRRFAKEIRKELAPDWRLIINGHMYFS